MSGHVQGLDFFLLQLDVAVDHVVVEYTAPNAQEDEEALVYVWRYEWAFNASSDVDWELSAFAVDDNARANDVLDYIVNRNFTKSFQFTQANIRGSTVAE